MSLPSDSAPLVLYNSLTGKKEPFVPSNGKIVKWYGCGPTVYDHSHIGHARNYVSTDIMQRIMSDYFGYSLISCMNITDIDSKILARSVAENKSPKEVATEWETEFFECMKMLNVRPQHAITRVTDYIPAIISMIEGIISNGYAYKSNGSVYFDLDAFLANPDHSYAKMLPNAASLMTSTIDGEKKNTADFCLWKAVKKGETYYWPSPWGLGVPGWHIECSAMAHQTLGDSIDIHTGGIDLRFPHHVNELAQTEAFMDKPGWVKYFIHCGHLNIDGLKMSKSLKNFIPIADILKEYPARYVRLLCLINHWGSDMNYNQKEDMQTAEALDNRIMTFLSSAKSYCKNAIDAAEATEAIDAAGNDLLTAKNTVHSAYLDNLDTPKAMMAMMNLIKTTMTRMAESSISSADVSDIYDYITKQLSILGLYSPNPESDITAVMDAFIKLRTDIKNLAMKCEDKNIKKQLYALSDKARDEYITEANIFMVDTTNDTTVWTQI